MESLVKSLNLKLKISRPGKSFKKENSGKVIIGHFRDNLPSQSLDWCKDKFTVTIICIHFSTFTVNSVATNNFMLLGIVCSIAKMVCVQILHLEIIENALLESWKTLAFGVFFVPGKS